MFDHIPGQPATAQLAADLERKRLPPSVLLAGPVASGKGTAALELARVFSCAGRMSAGTSAADAECDCPSCARHRLLSHPDTLCLGPRDFSAEIAGAADAFVCAADRGHDMEARERTFVLSIKKLLARFAVVLWEDDPKFGKLTNLILAVEEDVEEISVLKKSGAETARKRRSAILKDAVKLEAEGIADAIPINQVRRAAAWAHLAPVGKRKTLIIENADRMQEGARNSLLKILEEPPPAVSIILTTCHEQALLPTILSRVRPYRFVQRAPEVEAEVMRRVFGVDAQDEKSAAALSIAAYLKTFLPVTDDALRPLAAYLAASVAMTTALCLRRPASDLPWELVALGKYAAPIAEAAGLGRPVKNMQALIEKLLASTGNFEMRGLFSRFLQTLLALVGESLAEPPDAERGGSGGLSPAYLDIWRVCAAEAGASVYYNQKPAATLNRLAIDARRAMTALWRV
ncbi:MAG: DNA polymerase III [Treponema sp.]|jgi:DNA polymerase-3 subunit gamma/tau|nr:DNA polymerase III [Treponema sp.]